MSLPTFIQDTSPLVPDSASVAILVAEDGSYAVQNRDDKPGIWYPDHWGLFGGAIEPGETPEQSLVRELEEELALTVDHATLFTTFTFDFTACGRGPMQRYFYEVKTTRAAMTNIVLGEGRECRLVPPQELLHTYKLVPYDSFGLWMYFSQKRFIP